MDADCTHARTENNKTKPRHLAAHPDRETVGV